MALITSYPYQLLNKGRYYVLHSTKIPLIFVLSKQLSPNEKSITLKNKKHENESN